MTDEALSLQPTPEQLCYTFGGRDPLARIQPGQLLEPPVGDAVAAPKVFELLHLGDVLVAGVGDRRAVQVEDS